MRHMAVDVLVVGGGPAGLAAAWQARKSGAAKVLVIERNRELGGILPQCIHNGFGVRFFDRDLTGPEYAELWIHRAREEKVSFLLHTMVLEIDRDLCATVTSAHLGLTRIAAKAIILAMGCRERPRGALAIPGSRPSGVYTAGTAQRLVNMEGFMPGRRFVILGSGDIGMIMARRLTLEGAEIVAMIEILPYITGLRRNLVQCVRDYDIPLQLCTTITEVRGDERVEAVAIAEVDDRRRPMPSTHRVLECDTLLLSVGLIPENELSRGAGVSLDPRTHGPYVDQRLATSVPGIYAAGNTVHVYDLVDDVSASALQAGQGAAGWALGRRPKPMGSTPLLAGSNVHHVIPQYLDRGALNREPIPIQFRVRNPVEMPVHAQISTGDRVVASQRLRYVRPSEMVTLDLDPSLVADASELKVRVE